MGLLSWLSGRSDKGQDRPGEAGTGRVAKVGYVPPAGARGHLGKIADLLPYARVVAGSRQKQVFLARVPSNKRLAAEEFLYVHVSELDLDTDGNTKSWGKTAAEGTHKNTTSMGTGVDANVTPYVVLPLDGKGSWICNDLVKMGDVGVVIGKGRVVYVMFAESGPPEKIGEASIEVHRQFGHEVMGGAKVENTGIGGDFVILLFPRSGDGRVLSPEEIKRRAAPLFRALGGHP